MATFSDKQFEEMYKHFLTIKTEWLTLLIDNLVVVDTDVEGVEFRHVAFTSDSKLVSHAEHLLAEWQCFADVCDARREHNNVKILKENYAPVPFILKIEKSAVVNRRPAYSSSDLHRESIITRYDTLIKKFGSSKLAAPFIKAIKEERDYFIDQPEASVFRLRLRGFTDTAILHTPLEGEVKRIQVSSHGALLYSPSLTKDDIEFKETVENEKASVYDRMTPIKCSLFEQGDLYSLTQWEFERRYREAHRFVNRHDISMRHGWERREKEMRSKYRGTPKYEAFISKQKLLQPTRKFVIETDYALVERMRDVNDFTCNSIVEIRAKFLLDSELATGYYPQTVIKKRQELIDNGIPLYQDLIKKD